jgi:hypothetical protein
MKRKNDAFKVESVRKYLKVMKIRKIFKAMRMKTAYLKHVKDDHILYKAARDGEDFFEIEILQSSNISQLNHASQKVNLTRGNTKAIKVKA